MNPYFKSTDKFGIWPGLTALLYTKQQLYLHTCMTTIRKHHNLTCNTTITNHVHTATAIIVIVAAAMIIIITATTCININRNISEKSPCSSPPLAQPGKSVF